MSVVELEARILDLRLITLEPGLELIHLRLLVVELLLRDEPLSGERLVASERDAPVLELCHVPREGGLGLVQSDRERTRVDLGEHVALLDGLALLEEHLVEPAVDLAPHGDRGERQRVAQAIQVERHVARLCGGKHDRDGS